MHDSVQFVICSNPAKLQYLICTNQAIQGAKLKCEHEMNKMSHDLDEMTAEAAMSEEKVRI